MKHHKETTTQATFLHAKEDNQSTDKDTEKEKDNIDDLTKLVKDKDPIEHKHVQEIADQTQIYIHFNKPYGRAKRLL